MDKKMLKEVPYVKLLHLIRKEVLTGRLKAEKVIEKQKVAAYWKIGQHIAKHLLQNKDRAGYGDRLFERLAEDLQISQRTLERTVQFYRQFPIPSGRTELSWSHYRTLLVVKAEQKRDQYKKQAVNQGWNAQELEDAVKLDSLSMKTFSRKEGDEVKTASRLTCNRGRLYTNTLLKSDSIHITPAKDSVAGYDKIHLLVDCGFNILTNVVLKGVPGAKGGDSIESFQTDYGYHFRQSDANRKQLYTFVARVERIVDADTLWVNIDCGFDIWTRQKLRLRDIDAPELSTERGKKGKEFVQAALKDVEFVIVKTYKPDKYDRYLADVFYLIGETDPQKVAAEGAFLNQELLDQGLARIV
ncbi:DUF1016 N-terminal domain-containing protein [Candidatus Omnitrophota bacterium]